MRLAGGEGGEAGRQRRRSGHILATTPAAALPQMLRGMLAAALLTAALALTPAQVDLLLSLQGRLQELNVRPTSAIPPRATVDTKPTAPSWSSSSRCIRFSTTTARAR